MISFKKIYNKYIARKSIINFIYANRGCGKTFFFKKECINKGIYENKTSLFIRRYKNDCINFTNNFLNDLDIKDEFLKDIKIKNQSILYKNNVIIKVISLNESVSFKGALNFKNPYLIVFDEIESVNNRYIQNEATLLLDIIESFYRRKKPKVFLLSNAIKTLNPFNSFFNVKNLTLNKIKTYNNISVGSFRINENIETSKFLNINENYKNYYLNDYNINNYFKNDELLKDCIYSFYYLKKYFNIYYLNTTNEYVVKTEKKPRSNILISLSFELGKGIYFQKFKNSQSYYRLLDKIYSYKFLYCDKLAVEFVEDNFNI